MRAFLLLLGGVLALAVTLVLRLRGGAAPAGAPGPAVPAPAPTPTRPALIRPRRLPEPAHARSAGAGAMAHVRGRVLRPDGTPCNDADVQLDTGDGHPVEVVVDEQGTFLVHVPPRTYTITAASGDLVGAVDGFVAVAGPNQELAVRLAPGAEIEGHVRGAPALLRGLAAHLFPPGRRDEALGREMLVGEDGQVVANRLRPGNRYDLVLEGPSIRRVEILDLVAPARVPIAVQARPTLRGAVGLAPDGSCPVDDVVVAGADAEEEHHELDWRCHFEAKDLSFTGAVTVRATGRGFRLEEQVVLPAEGDPEPLCLNGPCSDAPTATLAITLAGVGPDEQPRVKVEWPERSLRQACESNPCLVEGLRPGLQVKVAGASGDCLAARFERLQLHVGANAVTVRCGRPREIQGVVRVAEGGPPPRHLVVRCPDGMQRDVHGAFVFAMECASDARQLDWSVDEESWSHVPLGEANPVLVELTVPAGGS